MAQPQSVTALTPPPRFEVVQVTPALAELWLGKNVRNRRVRHRVVTAYAKDMAAGRWLLTGEPIKFATDETLIDGQHRLLAVIESAATVSMVIAYNIAVATQDVMDTGSRRLAADVLTLHGRENAALLGATAKWCVLWDADMLYVDRAARAVTHADILDYVIDNEELDDAVTFATTIRTHVDLQPSILATAIYLTGRKNRDACGVFFARLADGVGLEAGSPILALRSRLREIKNNRQRVEGEALLSVTLRAWNAWREGRSMATIPVYRGSSTIRCPEPRA